MSHLFWVSVQSGALAAGKEFHADIVWDGPAKETDFVRQVEIVDSMVRQRMDGIAIAAGDRKALVPAVDRAAAAGIPITVFDSGIDSENYISYVSTDNVEAGRMAARKIASLLQGKARIGMLLHAPGSASTMDREKGFTTTVDREFPEMKVVAREYGMSDPAQSRVAADKMIDGHPEMTAMFASSEPSSVGAALAIKARGAQQRVYLMAFDSSEAMVDDLKGGAIDAMVVQDPYRMGYEAVRTLAMKLRGDNPPRRLDLNAVVVEAKDLNEPSVRRLLNLT